MTISADFDAITTPKIATTYLGDEWDGLARALKACKDIGVALDAATVTVSSAGAIGAVSGDFSGTLQVDGNATIGDGGASSGERILDIDSQLNLGAILSFSSAGTEFWRWEMDVQQALLLKTADTDTVITIEPSAAANAFYIDQDGHIGFGADPTATFEFTTGAIQVETSAPDASLYIDAAGDVGFGRAPASGFELELYRATGAVNGRFISGLSAGTVDLTLENGTQSWELQLSTTGFFQLNDDTNSVSPFTVEPLAPTFSIYVDAAGNIGLGADPTSSNKLLVDNGAAALDARLRTSGAVACSLLLENSAATWRLFTTSTGLFQLQDAVGATTPITVEEAADNNALYIDADGHVGLGLDPGASFDFIAALGGTDTWRFQSGDGAATFQINSGATVAQNTDVSFLDQFVTQWNIRKDSSNNLIIRDAPAGRNAVVFSGSTTNIIQIDDTGIAFFNTTPAAQPAAYTRNATIVVDRTLLASASATATNNNNVLAALIVDLQSLGLIG